MFWPFGIALDVLGEPGPVSVTIASRGETHLLVFATVGYTAQAHSREGSPISTETTVGPLEVTPNTGAPSAVNRYWHPGERDWLSVPAHGNQPTPDQLAAYGYQAVAAPQFYVSMVGNSDMVANYRWWHPDDEDWIDVPDGSVPDAEMTANGYINKTFQYYAYPTRVPGTVAVNRWWHPGDRDWLTLRQNEVTDAQMASDGYQDKTLLFYAFPERTRSTQMGYFKLGTPQKAVLSPMPWSGEDDHPHTFSVLDVNPAKSPTINQGFRYLGYWGHHECSGIGTARTNDLNGTWKQSNTPLFSGNGERWACALVNPDNTVGIVHNVYWCGGNPDGGAYYIVGRKSTNGLNGTTFSRRVAIVKEQTVENGNPTLFRDPADGRVYLYWFRNAGDTYEIRVKDADTFDDLLDADPADLGTLVAFSEELVAAPHVIKVGGLYYLAVETQEQDVVWKTRVLTSTSPFGPFYEIPDGPVYGDNSACVFQHVFGTTLHSWYCNEGTADSGDWTLDHVTAPL